MISLLFWIPVGILVILIISAEFWVRYEQLSCIECGFKTPHQWVEDTIMADRDGTVIGAYMSVHCPQCKTRHYQRYANRIQ